MFGRTLLWVVVSGLALRGGGFAAVERPLDLKSSGRADSRIAAVNESSIGAGPRAGDRGLSRRVGNLAVETQGLAVVPTAVDGRFSGGQPVRLEAVGPAATEYQWFVDGRAIPSATNRIFVATWSVPAASGHYSVRAAGVDGTVREASTVVTVARALPGTLLGRLPVGDAIAEVSLDDDGAIYFGGYDKRVRSVDSSSGRVQWDFLASYWVSTPVAISDHGLLHFGTGFVGTTFYTLAMRSGTLEAQIPINGNHKSPAAISPEGQVYFGGYDGRLHALDQTGGSEAWSFDAGGLIRCAPAVGPGNLVLFATLSGRVGAVNRTTGALGWEFAAGEQVASGFAFGADGTVYFTCRNGKLFALDSRTGKAKWEHSGQISEVCSPVVGGDGTVYAGDQLGQLVAFNGATGEPRWRIDAGGTLGGAPTIGNDGTLYVGTGWPHPRLLAVNGRTGTVTWTVALNAPCDTSPVITTDGTVYVGTRDLYAVASASTGLADAPWPTFQADFRRTGRFAEKVSIRLVQPSRASPMTLQAHGLWGRSAVIEESIDLKTWTERGSATNGSVIEPASGAGIGNERFLRVRIP